MATTFNFNVPLLNADGNVSEDTVNGQTTPVLLGKLLSDIIMGSAISDQPLKYFDWALSLRQGTPLVLDDVDKDKLSAFITNAPSLTTLGKGRLLKLLSSPAAPIAPTSIIPTDTNVSDIPT